MALLTFPRLIGSTMLPRALIILLLAQGSVSAQRAGAAGTGAEIRARARSFEHEVICVEAGSNTTMLGIADMLSAGSIQADNPRELELASAARPFGRQGGVASAVCIVHRAGCMLHLVSCMLHVLCRICFVPAG